MIDKQLSLLGGVERNGTYANTLSTSVSFSALSPTLSACLED
jgi:hypothetical protein